MHQCFDICVYTRETAFVACKIASHYMRHHFVQRYLRTKNRFCHDVVAVTQRQEKFPKYINGFNPSFYGTGEEELATLSLPCHVESSLSLIRLEIVHHKNLQLFEFSLIKPQDVGMFCMHKST